MIQRLVIVFILLASGLHAQSGVYYLRNLYGKNNADQIAQVRDNVTELDSSFFTSKYSQFILDLAWGLRKRGVLPQDFSSLFGAVDTAVDSGHAVILPEGQFELSDSLVVWRPVLIRGLARGSSKEGVVDTTGARVKVRINNSQPAIIDTVAGSLFENFSLLADTSKSTGEGIRIRRKKQTTTIGNTRISGVTIKDFKSHGIHYYAPDNNGVIEHSHIASNRGFGLYLQTSTGSKTKGLNAIVQYNRFISNDSGAIRNYSVAHSLFLGNGLLGTQNSKPLIDLRGHTGSLMYNVFIANDIEGEAGGDGTRAPIFQMYNTRGDVWIGNRIGQSESSSSDTTGEAGKPTAIAVRGHVRSLLSIQNRYVGWRNPATDSVIICYPGGVINLFQIGDHAGFHGKDIKIIGSGSYRYFDMWLDRDTLYAAIDAGSSGSFLGLYLNPFAKSSVHFYARATQGSHAYTYWWAYQGSGVGGSNAADSIGRIGGVSSGKDFIIESLFDDLVIKARSGSNILINNDKNTTGFTKISTKTLTNAVAVDNEDNMIGFNTNNPKNFISIYGRDASTGTKISPSLAITDSLNMTLGSTAQVEDTSCIVFSFYSGGKPKINLQDNNGDTLLIIGQNGGLIVGDPTGGDKGLGTINAKAVYDDNTLLSDSEFEQYYAKRRARAVRQAGSQRYLGLHETIQFVSDSLHLPTMPGREEWQRREGKISLGEMNTRLWQTVERQHLHMAELYDKIRRLEQRIQFLESEKK